MEFYSDDSRPLKIRGFIQDLKLAKRRATQLELTYQPEKLYFEALLEVLSKSISDETNTNLLNEFMVS